MLPILPLKAVCLPGEVITVQITEERYQQMIQRCVKHAGELAVVFCSDYKDELGTIKNVGCQAQIVHFEVCLNGDFEIHLLGLNRFEFTETEPKLHIHYASDVKILENVKDISAEDAVFSEVNESYKSYMEELINFDAEMAPKILIDNVSYETLFKVLSDISMPWEKKQQGLEINSTKKRLKYILSCLQFERDMLRFVSDKVKDETSTKTLVSLN